MSFAGDEVSPKYLFNDEIRLVRFAPSAFLICEYFLLKGFSVPSPSIKSVKGMLLVFLFHLVFWSIKYATVFRVRCVMSGSSGATPFPTH